MKKDNIPNRFGNEDRRFSDRMYPEGTRVLATQHLYMKDKSTGENILVTMKGRPGKLGSPYWPIDENSSRVWWNDDSSGEYKNHFWARGKDWEFSAPCVHIGRVSGNVYSVSYGNYACNIGTKTTAEGVKGLLNVLERNGLLSGIESDEDCLTFDDNIRNQDGLRKKIHKFALEVTA